MHSPIETIGGMVQEKGTW